ncbi:5-formyltetrahydrofolate cyclo-ligase [Streptomyces calidiresistens]|uniref:5-formyltetrahydrofolate cyclo-ligase n=1 Tax=Streptomyces calidiresistens TaxID=1485586 RepID=A0A7W3T5W4_9ACTN|nr:5-formyltetrahydrofolate cyclo-ligase [Streptomyces calidiresistens]MBB0231221.1 5-formyltetrahydrofolate cyclo-ligase [Streptomyces calidiresistens]
MRHSPESDAPIGDGPPEGAGSLVTDGAEEGATAERKREVRRDLQAVRAAMTAEEALEAAESLAERVLSLPEVAAARTVAAYVAVGREPGTRLLLEELRRRGVRVLLPVLLPDDDLDWALYEGRESLRETEHGNGRIRLFEPAGGSLGPDAVHEADVVLLPGLAVDSRGVRLGRGGGSYDRALARLIAGDGGNGSDRGPLLAVLLYGHEVMDELPCEAHDRPVHLAVTPEGVHRITGARPATG